MYTTFGTHTFYTHCARMSTPGKYILTIIFFVATSIIWYFVAYLPTTNSLHNYHARCHQAAEQKRLYEKKISSIEQLYAITEELQNNKNRFIQTVSDTTFLEPLYSANLIGTLQTYTHTLIEHTKEYCCAAISLTFKGTYQQLIDCFTAIDSSCPYTTIVSYAITNNSGHKATAHCQLRHFFPPQHQKKIPST